MPIRCKSYLKPKKGRIRAGTQGLGPVRVHPRGLCSKQPSLPQGACLLSFVTPLSSHPGNADACKFPEVLLATSQHYSEEILISTREQLHSRCICNVMLLSQAGFVPFFSNFKPLWHCPRSPVCLAAAIDRLGPGQEGKIFLSLQLSLQLPGKEHLHRYSHGSPVNSVLLGQSQGFPLPAQLPSPWCNACLSHVAVVSDTLLRVLQGSAQLGAELQAPFHS